MDQWDKDTFMPFYLNHVELESVVPNKTYWQDSETALVTRINLFLLIDFSLSLHHPQTYDDFVVVRCVLQMSEPGEHGTLGHKFQAFGQFYVILQPERGYLVTRRGRYAGDGRRRYLQALYPDPVKRQLRQKHHKSSTRQTNTNTIECLTVIP